MSSRRFVFGLFTALLGLTAFNALHAEARRRAPNVVLILIDDLGSRDLGIMGNRFIETPRIDELARQGMLFTEAYANAPNCSPSRASILTGQYPVRHGIVTVGSATRGPSGEANDVDVVPNKERFPSQTQPLPAALARAGYAVACIGKWHIGRGNAPEESGCQLSVKRAELGYEAHSRVRNENAKAGPSYLADELTDVALKFMQKHRAQPFFVYMAHYSVHRPWVARPKTVEKYENKPRIPDSVDPQYAAMVEEADRSVGRLLDELEALKLERDTLVVLTSDNGGAPSTITAAGFRGGKGSLYEAGLRVPLILRWPGEIPEGTSRHVPVVGMDLYPTLLEIAGVEVAAGHQVDGASLVPLFRAGEAEPRAIFWYFPAFTRLTSPAAAVRLGNWKLIEYLGDSRRELYDLSSDPAESTNLASKIPARVDEMLGALAAWRSGLDSRAPP